MKKLIFLANIFLISIRIFGQTQGISYQAVILDKTPMEVPGRDITGNIMPNHPLMVRFSILDAAGTIEYQEEHSATTDMFGVINLTIGKGIRTGISPGDFKDIDWSGTPKALKVDISINTSDVFYTDFSYAELVFVPYAYHKNISATGSLIVDGMTSLRSRVDVTDGSPKFLSGDLRVDKETTLNNNLIVYAPSNLKGQVTIDVNKDDAGDDSNYDSYPLRVQGSKQGIAVKITGTKSVSNNFVTFWDDENVQGRIEGQTIDNLEDDPEYIFDNIMLAENTVMSGIDVAKATAEVVSASTSSTGCVGLGACVTAPVPSLIAGAIANLALEAGNLAMVIAEEVLYNKFRRDNIGVTYQSGAGDYAEWLPKSDPNEKFLPGDIVGVKGGAISKSTEGAGHLMVVSYNPIVLGNMPPSGKEKDYEKVAFLGQVRVKVIGRVKPGDYILAAGDNNGTGIAVSPGDLRTGQYSLIVGVAWGASESQQYGYVNVAVGLNSHNGTKLVVRQEEIIKEQETEIKSLKEQLNKMNNVLAQLLPNYSSLMNNTPENVQPVIVASPSKSGSPEERIIFYHEVTRNDLLNGIDLAKETLKERGVDVSKNPFFRKMETEPDFKECFINDALTSIKKEIDKSIEQNIKSGNRAVKLF